MERPTKNNFVFYLDWCDIIDDLPDDQALVLVKAINKFVKRREDTKIENSTLQAIFNLIKKKIIEDAEKYEEVCKKRSEARNRNKNQEQKTQESTSATIVNNCQQKTQESTKATDSDSEGDSDCDCEYEGDSELNKESKKEKKERRSRTTAQFVKPTLEEIRVFCQERNSTVDPEVFFDHYESNGWVQSGGKAKIKNWQATVRNWERRQNKSPPIRKPDKRTSFFDDVDDIVIDLPFGGKEKE